MSKPKMEEGWRLLNPDEMPQPGDEIRHYGEKHWERNFLAHDTPAGSYLWGRVWWRRRTTPAVEVFIPLTALPEFLKGKP